MEKIDWNDLWKQARLNYTLGQNNVCSPDFWDKLWKSPYKSETTDNERLDWIISKLNIKRDDTILDIGCGPGILTIPLAHKAKHVTAVDISPIALKSLEKKAIEDGLNNITYISKKWEDVEEGLDIDIHDVVLSSYALTMLDLKSVFNKMGSVAKRAVCIFETAGPKYWHQKELWPMLYGQSFRPSPDYIYIVNVLHQMSIYANVEIAEYEMIQRYTGLDEAVQQWKAKLEVTKPRELDVIKNYLSKTLKRDGDSFYLNDIQKIAMILWNK